jgi:hypothetical protein
MNKIILIAILATTDAFVKGGWLWKLPSQIFCEIGDDKPIPTTVTSPTKLSVASITELFNTYRNSIKTVPSLLIDEKQRKNNVKQQPRTRKTIKLTPISEEPDTNTTTISQIHRNIITKNVITAVESPDITDFTKIQIIKNHGWLFDHNQPPLARGGLLKDWKLKMDT